MAGLDSCVFRFDMRLMRSTPMLHLFVALQLLILFYVQRLMLRTMESDEGEEQEGGKRKKNGSTLSDDQPVDALEAYATYRRYERVRVLGSGTQGIAMLCRDPSPDGEGGGVQGGARCRVGAQAARLLAQRATCAPIITSREHHRIPCRVPGRPVALPRPRVRSRRHSCGVY